MKLLNAVYCLKNDPLPGGASWCEFTIIPVSACWHLGNDLWLHPLFLEAYLRCLESQKSIRLWYRKAKSSINVQYINQPGASLFCHCMDICQCFLPLFGIVNMECAFHKWCPLQTPVNRGKKIQEDIVIASWLGQRAIHWKWLNELRAKNK